MSTENSSDQLFNNSVKILTDLISFKTISGEDNSSLINYCDEILKKLALHHSELSIMKKKGLIYSRRLRLKTLAIKSL